MLIVKHLLNDHKAELDQPQHLSTGALLGAPNEPATEWSVSAKTKKRGEPSGSGSPQTGGRRGRRRGSFLFTRARSLLSSTPVGGLFRWQRRPGCSYRWGGADDRTRAG